MTWKTLKIPESRKRKITRHPDPAFLENLAFFTDLFKITNV